MQTWLEARERCLEQITALSPEEQVQYANYLLTLDSVIDELEMKLRIGIVGNLSELTAQFIV